MQSEDIEILAPVADEMMLRAAVHSGANAIYLGMPGFNARGRTPNFDDQILKQFIEFCHLYGVKVYVAFNILIFENELKQVIELLCRLLSLSPDAIIVQDIGLARLIKHICPDQEIHASTQMTISSAEAIKATSELDIARYILARELSVAEIKAIKTHCDKELEVFIHGALCVSYSGQCLTSESIGGRSANRGQCAQSCRFEYDLIVDGKKKDLGAKRYLVSPFDLCAKEEIRDLMNCGIRCFKIEGRYKSPEYIVATVDFYRRISSGEQVSKRDVDALSILYSRGFYSGWLNGVNHQNFVNSEYSNHHGLLVGRVVAVQQRSIIADINYDIVAGDGVLIRNDDSGDEIGGFVYQVKKHGSNTELYFAQDFKCNNLLTGMSIFVNSSASVERAKKRAYTDKSCFKRIAVDCEIAGGLNSPLRCVYRDRDSNEVSEESDGVLEKASRMPLSEDFARSELGALSNTPFILGDIKFNVAEEVFIHQRELKKLRQKSIEKLIEKRRSRPRKHILSAEAAIEFCKAQCQQLKKKELRSPLVHVLVRKQEQIAGLAGLGVDTVYCDFNYGSIYSEAVKIAKDIGLKVGIATTRIFKPGERKTLDAIINVSPDVILVRNFGAYEYIRNNCKIPQIADFSFNVANSVSASWLFNKGFVRICPSYDLNHIQLNALIANTDSERIEVTVHQYIPAFHMDYCVFASYLSSGCSYRNCGRVCEQYCVELRDRKGIKHPVHADLECRNTVYNGIAQSAARLIPGLIRDGVFNFRVEALFETAEELKEKVFAYQSILSGRQSYSDAFKRLKIVEQYGLGEGQLLNDRVYEDRKKG